MCPNCQNVMPKIIRKGFFTTKRGRKIQRYRCLACGKYHCKKSLDAGYRLRRYHLRNRIFRMFCQGIAQREIALELKIHRETVASLLKVIAKEAAKQNAKHRALLNPHTIVFDEMETFEHSKMKPVSIVVAVEDKTRRLIGLEAACMPAKGLLARKSRRKYGLRPDHRPAALRKVMGYLAKYSALKYVKSDMSPRYPKYVKEQLRHVDHIVTKGRRGCVVGQGELKEGGFDPIFSLNHTAARIRDLIKRLTRRTWCTTKKIERLQMFLEIFMCHFNKRLAGAKRPAIDTAVRCS